MFKDHIKHLELYRMQQSKESLDILYNLPVQYQKSDFIVHLLCQAFPIGINEGEIYSWFLLEWNWSHSIFKDHSTVLEYPSKFYQV